MADEKKSDEWWKPILATLALTTILGALAWGFTSTNGRVDRVLDRLENHQDRIVRLETKSEFSPPAPDGTGHIRARRGTVAPHRRLHE
jgi:hypothetical protein